ncbi:MAG: thioredoxin domain-containing protein [Desulfobacterales bacterium]
MVPLFEQLLEQYPEDVKLIFKNYPLSRHAYAKKAAIAAVAAQKQEKFWEYHDRLFENYDRLNDQKFREIARELNLDMEKFEKDLKDPATILRVDKDARLGHSVGVGGTPTVFINGSISKARTLEELRATVEDNLQKARRRAGLSEGQMR